MQLYHWWVNSAKPSTVPVFVGFTGYIILVLKYKPTTRIIKIGFTNWSYEMELGFCDLFTSYEMELETRVHVQIENQPGFHELQIACYN